MSIVAVRSGFISVGSGFIAIRTTIGSPFDMPPSMPPARFVRRRNDASSNSSSSCTSEPRREAFANPSPISTPFMAWIASAAAPSRASSRSRGSVCEPSPGGQPKIRTSTMPPSVS